MCHPPILPEANDAITIGDMICAITDRTIKNLEDETVPVPPRTINMLTSSSNAPEERHRFRAGMNRRSVMGGANMGAAMGAKYMEGLATDKKDDDGRSKLKDGDG